MAFTRRTYSLLRKSWIAMVSRRTTVQNCSVIPSLNEPPERIRNTLSHEMCHLACWIIDEAPTENHGALFKRW